MPIAELSHAAANAISSASAIYDSRSAIKELLDNALDACATSISVDISQDALSVLQVKDNGSGIPSGDRKWVCKPHHTSKVQSIEDLKHVGPRSLGFRGLALASIVEMSGGVLVTTTTNEDQVASKLTYNRTGQLLCAEPVAHSTGTTVRVSEFLKHLPVRRKVALKSSSTAIARVRNLLRIYAMARPAVRFSLKVTGGRGDGDWIYATEHGASIITAIVKIAGADVASQCISKEVEVFPEPPEDTFSDDQMVDTAGTSTRLIATLPKASAGISSINRCGQYISIDGRPLSPDKGIAKSLVKLYKSYIRSALLEGDKSQPKVVDPFLCIYIKCKPGSYDINVEPAKDDVIIENHPAFLSAADDLFKQVYGEVVSGGPYTLSGGRGCNSPPPRQESKNIGAASTSPSTQHKAQETTRSHVERGQATPHFGFPSRTSAIEPGGTNTTKAPSARRNNLSPPSLNRTSKNHWTVTSLNTLPNGDDEQNRALSSSLLTPRRGRNSTTPPPNSSEPARLSTAFTLSTPRYLPSPTSRSDGSPLKSAPPAAGAGHQTSGGVTPRNHPESPPTSDENGTLDRWIQKFSSQCSPVGDQARSPLLDQDLANEAISAVDLDRRFASAQGSHAGAFERSRLIHPDSCVATKAVQGTHVREADTPAQSDPGLEGDSSSRNIVGLPPLDEAMDFERRKKWAAQYQRSLRSAVTVTNESNSTAGRAVPEASTGTPPQKGGRGSGGTTDISRDFMITTPAGDPSSSFSRPNAGKKQSDELPLENISAGSAVHHLAIPLPSESADIVCISHTLSMFDSYIASGDVFSGFSQPISTDELVKWKKQLLEMTSRDRSGDISSNDSLSSMDLDSILRAHWFAIDGSH